jgi:tetratricopeptide (TPR) repeat protein
MEENSLPPAPEQEQTGCAQCAAPDVLDGYPTRLCASCRDTFVKFPIPKWLWLFAGAIGVIVLFSLFTLPKNISTGIALEKGKKAERAHRYVTAQREFEKVVAAVPGYTEGRAHMMIASFYNDDYSSFLQTYKTLENVPIEDKELFARLEGITDKAINYFPGDSMRQLTAPYDSSGTALPDTLLLRYIHGHDGDLYAKGQYAFLLIGRDDYKGVDSVAATMLAVDETFDMALFLRSVAQRETGHYEASLKYCDQLLNINRESSKALASKARTLLKMKDDKEALKIALRACSLNEKDSYAIATLAIAYHFNHEEKKRDELVNRYKNDSSMASNMEYALDIFSGKEHFRD